jgi:hypothetical protein
MKKSMYMVLILSAAASIFGQKQKTNNFSFQFFSHVLTLSLFGKNGNDFIIGLVFNQGVNYDA